MKNKFAISFLFLSLLSNTLLCSGDEFDKVQCNSDIPKAMLGRYSPNSKVVEIERRHKDIGLKALGADDLGTDNEQFSTVYWMICGNRFITIDADNHIRGVMQLAPKINDASEYTGKCKSNNEEIPEFVFALIENKVIRNAWKIDKKKGFIKLDTKELECN